MSELSPQAQAVLDATFRKWMEIDDIDDGIPGKIAAAALRAAADQVVPETSKPNDTFCCPPVETIVYGYGDGDGNGDGNGYDICSPHRGRRAQ